MEKSIYELIFTSALEGILVTDQGGKIIAANPALEKMFGYKKGELKGKSIESLIPKKYEKGHKQHREKYNKKPAKRKMGTGIDLFARHRSGREFPVEISLNYVGSPTGILVFAYVIDVTARKKMELALHDLNTALERRVEERTNDLENAILELQKTNQNLGLEVNRRKQAEAKAYEALGQERELGELKSRFVTMASHEFRTPLSTILSSNSLLSRYIESGEIDKQNKHIDRIKGSVKNMIEILNEGKVEAHPEPIDLKLFLEDLVEEMEPNLKPGQHIKLSMKGNLAAIMLDRSMLKHIMVNLVSNAIKYSPVGTALHLGCIVLAKIVSLSIRDEGIGIPHEDQKHLFERFFRAKNSINIQGTGLGLNIVKKYVELMQGEINFKSKLEKGSTFEVKLPRIK